MFHEIQVEITVVFTHEEQASYRYQPLAQIKEGLLAARKDPRRSPYEFCRPTTKADERWNLIRSWKLTCRYADVALAVEHVATQSFGRDL